jgi:hypothetical protein
LTNCEEIARDEVMKVGILRQVSVRCVAATILAGAIGIVLAQPRETVKLNESGLAFAEQLIREGRVVADGKGAWSKHQPSTEAENQFIRLHGFKEYAKWHLGIDLRFAENTKQRYRFPYGDFQRVHRSALLAAQNRAAQFKYSDIEAAAISLRKMIEAQAVLDSKR